MHEYKSTFLLMKKELFEQRKLNKLLMQKSEEQRGTIEQRELELSECKMKICERDLELSNQAREAIAL